MKLLFGLVFSASGERRGQEADFIPPEMRFDFNQMGRKVKEDPQHPGRGILNYEMQTIKTSREQEEARQEALKFATPEELEVIHAQHRKDFHMGQDLNLLENSNDISNLGIVIKSHRCDACRIVAMELSKEFWDLEERFSRKTRLLAEEIVYDGLEEFCLKDNWENVGLTQTMKLNHQTGDIEKDLWRITAEGFETWEERGEITATSQLWPIRFSKVCSELIEDYDEWELYEFWKKITKDSEDPKISLLDDLLCFSKKKSDCNRFRNPSTVKSEPILADILEGYLKFKDEINERRKQDREKEWKKLMKEQKRVMGMAYERQKQKELEEKEKETKEADETENGDVKTEL